MIRVLVADDHVFYREGVTAMLDGHRDIAVVAEAATGEEAVHRTAVAQPDVVPMDLRMPGTGGIEATRRIAADQPEVAVLVLTMFDDDSVFAAMHAGACGYGLKHATPRRPAPRDHRRPSRRGHLQPHDRPAAAAYRHLRAGAPG